MVRARTIAALLLAAGIAVSAAGCESAAVSDAPMSDRITNAADVVSSIRRGLKNHAKSITVTFDYGSDIFGELNGVIDAWVEAALAETDGPAEGDYIRYRYGGYTYESSYTAESGRYYYTVKLTPVYYTYRTQEEAVTEKVGELIKGFGFRRSTSDAEKIFAIYDYLCQNVRYDKVHRKNPYSHLKSTAYSALVLNTATCQGYCAALYRLLREAGISCRIVTGSAGDETLHAWVIAELDGVYYNLDPTWDAGNTEYQYFLVGESGFADHVRSEKFAVPDFAERYPMSEEDYVYDAA